MSVCERLPFVVMIPSMESMCSFPIYGLLRYVEGGFALSTIHVLVILRKIEGLCDTVPKGAGFIREDGIGAPIRNECVRVEG